LCHMDRTRRRLLVVVADGELACCDVAIEGHEVDCGVPAAAEELLGRRLQCVVEANAWEGGASTVALVGTPAAPSAGWINARIKWASSDGLLEGGGALVPTAPAAGSLAHLPGGCWVHVVPDPGGAIRVEIGSLAVEAAEVVRIGHSYDAMGKLIEVRCDKVVMDVE
jgi:hypothetical protein